MLKSPKIPTIVLLIALVALILRLYFLTTEPEIPADPYHLAKIAEGMLDLKLSLKGFFFSTFWPAVQPLYPMLMALVSLFVEGDLLLSGKIIALIAGVATIPVVYLLWEKIESREVALLASWLVAVNHYSWFFSVHAFRDTLFMFFVSLSFLLLYKVREDFERLPALALVLGLATLTREDTYLLVLSFIITLVYWKRRARKKDIHVIKKSAAVYLLIVFPWFFYRFIEMRGELIPVAISKEIEVKGRAGFLWLPAMVELVALPVFVTSIAGFFLTKASWKKYLPFYLFIIPYSLAHMLFVKEIGTMPRYALALLPLFVGWASVALDAGIRKVTQVIPKGESRAYIALTLVLLVIPTLAYGAVKVTELESQRGKFNVIESAVRFFDSTSENNATLLVGGEDDNLFDYFTKKRVLSEGDMVNELLIIKAFSKADIEHPVESFLVSEDIHYLVAYESIHSWAYKRFDIPELRNFEPLEGTFRFQRMSMDPKIDDFGFKKGEKFKIRVDSPVKMRMVFTPLKRFDENNQTVLLYRIDWYNT